MYQYFRYPKYIFRCRKFSFGYLHVEWLFSSFFFYSILRWSVAVSTMRRQSLRIAAFLQADARPRSASTARSQVWIGLPNGRFQSGGSPRITAATAWWWSSWWAADNVSEEPQTSVSDQVGEMMASGRLGLAIVPLCRGTGVPLRRTQPTQAPLAPSKFFDVCVTEKNSIIAVAPCLRLRSWWLLSFLS